MASVKPDEARQFHEDDEDPARVFAIFDAAKQEGRTRRTEPPSRSSDLVPLRDVARELWRELRLRDRFALLLRHLADTIQHRAKV
jgi:hypothetical protein